MNSQERSILQNFLAQLAQVRGVNKDPEANELIGQALARQPDAGYLLVQRALLLDQALEQAKARIAQLEQLQGTNSSSGFLNPGGSGWGSSAGQSAQNESWVGRPSAPPPQYAGGPPAYYPAAGPAPGGGFSSFLGQAAATAAGVAGGEFLFQGIENMLGRHEGGGFEGGFGNMSAPVEDVTVNNNYYFPEESPPDDFGRSGTDVNDPSFTSDNDDDFSDDQDLV
jgi:hypothetical protein